MMMAQHYTVEPGNTLSEIGQRFGISWQSIWRASDPPVSDPNLIFAGEVLNIPVGGSGSTYSPSTPTQGSQVASAPQSSPSAVYAPAGGFQACVIQRESSGNPRAVNSIPGYIGDGGGLYGFLASTWHELGYTGEPFNYPASVQTQAFQRAYAMWGTSPWAPSDHC
jgi:hypothetical protein